MGKKFAAISMILTAAVLFGCIGGAQPEATPTPGASATPMPTPRAAEVSIEGNAFIPTSLTVPVGTTVIWTNNDETHHTITSDSGNELGASPLDPGQRYYHTFSTPGTYGYHCGINTSIHGSIIVTP